MLPLSKWVMAAALASTLALAGNPVSAADEPDASPSPSPTVPQITPEMGMESELAALGFPTGRVDGIIDRRTRRALCAYRDLTGVMASRGLPSPEIMLRISKTTSLPALPRKLRKVRALVSLTCQTVYVTNRRGKILRILAVSTGKDRGFHATRTGFKRVYFKYNAWQHSDLFPEPDGRPGLYRPVYFDRGIAFHGVRKPIRTKPQSHGCVRTWPEDQDWLFKKLKMRDRVFVYGNYWKIKTAALGGYGPDVPFTPPGYVPPTTG